MLPRRHLSQSVQIVNILVPKVVEELVQERISERIAEQIANVSVRQSGEQLVEMPKAVFRDGFQQRVGEQIVDRSCLKGEEELMQEVFGVSPGEHLGAHCWNGSSMA